MKKSDNYLKIVEWSEEDQCYVGTCPNLMLGGIHGDDEAKVYRQLCQAVEEWIEIYEKDGDPLPEPGMPKSRVGMRAPPSLALLADSGPSTPRTSPVPKESRLREVCTTWP